MFCGRNLHPCGGIKRLERSSYPFTATLYDCDKITEPPLKTTPMKGSSEGVSNIKYFSLDLKYEVDFLPIEICSVIWLCVLAVLYQCRNNRMTILGIQNTDNLGAQ
jgi:hypothetical protein